MSHKFLLPLLFLTIVLAACGQAAPTATPPPTDLPPLPAAPTVTRPALQPAPVSQEQMTAEAAEAQAPTQETPAAEQPEQPDGPEAADAITADMLANMTYSSEFTQSGSAPLEDGEYSEAVAPHSATETRVWLTDRIAYGEMDGQPVAAAVLISDPGGSGTFYSLHIAGLEDGQAVELASVLLGDRVEIEALELSGGQAVVQMLVAGPDDPLCCPTQEVVRVYELQDGELVTTADEALGGTDEAPAQSLLNRIWGWEARTEDGSDAGLSPDPQSYTLTFAESGTYTYNADCTGGRGIYSADDEGGILLQASSESLADCGPGSFAAAMKDGLRQARSFRRENGLLYLRWEEGGIEDVYRELAPAVSESGGLAIDASQVSLDTQGIFDRWTAVEVPASGVDAGALPGPRGLPDHIEIYFDYNDPAQRDGGAIMYIIPVEAYSQQYAAMGFDWVDRNIDAIYEFARTPQDPPPLNGVPILPNEEVRGVNDLAAQITGTGAGLQSASQTGYRFIGRSVQESSSVTNEDLRYIYQGFTNDGRYLVAFFTPIRSDELPDAAAEVAPEAQEALAADLVGYLGGEAQRLNTLPPYAWEPDLAALDALVNSLRIEGMAPAGLQGPTWTWTGQINNPAGGEVSEETLLGDYTAVYDEALTLTYVADCSQGSTGYELLSGGMDGDISVLPAASTLAVCGPGSLAEQFAAMLAEAESYSVLPGGREMLLGLPDGRGYLMRAEEEAAGGEASLEAAPIAPDDVQAGSTAELFEQGITLDVTGVADTYTWVIRPETPIGEGPGGEGLPRHILLTFDGEEAPEAVANNSRRLYIFPTRSYLSLYEAAESDAAGRQVARLQALIDSAQGRQGQPDGWMPLLPPPQTPLDRWAQFRDYDFIKGMGVRYVADAAGGPDAGVWSSDTTAYYYQGLTEDGRYYVSLYWPVSAGALPATAADAPPEIREMAENPETQALHVQETRNALNALPPTSFEPPLSLLDTMVNSLEVGG